MPTSAETNRSSSKVLTHDSLLPHRPKLLLAPNPFDPLSTGISVKDTSLPVRSKSTKPKPDSKKPRDQTRTVGKPPQSKAPLEMVPPAITSSLLNRAANIRASALSGNKHTPTSSKSHRAPQKPASASMGALEMSLRRSMGYRVQKPKQKSKTRSSRARWAGKENLIPRKDPNADARELRALREAGKGLESSIKKVNVAQEGHQEQLDEKAVVEARRLERALQHELSLPHMMERSRIYELQNLQHTEVRCL